MIPHTLPQLDLCLAFAGGTPHGGPFGWTGILAAAAVILAAVCASRWICKLSGPSQPGLDELRAVPVDAAGLPACAAAFFQKHHAAIVDLGFSLAGDYQMRHGRHPTYDRYYYRPDLDVWVELSIATLTICRFIRLPSIHTFGFVSVFEDGTYLCTSTMRVPEEHEFRPPQLVYRSRPGLNAAQLLAAHLRCIDEYVARNSTRTLHYPAEQIVDVSIYYTQYQRDYWTSKGIISPPPGHRTSPAPTNPQYEEPSQVSCEGT